MALSLNEEILSALKTLQKYNFKEAEIVLKQEAGLLDNKSAEEFFKFKAQASDEPEHFGTKYQCLLSFIEKISDNHKLELSTLLYPVFVYLYLRLISGGLCDEARRFLETFRKYQEDFYQSDIILLAHITDPDQLLLNPLVESFRSSEFVVSVANSSYTLLRHFLQQNGLGIIQNVLNEQLSIEVIDGPPRTRLQLDVRRGALFGEAPREANKEPVLYGLLLDPALRNSGGTESSQMITDGPLNDAADARQALARENATLLRGHRQQQKPIGTSVVMYTVCNVQAGESTLAIRRGGVNCTSFSDNAGWLAAGFGSGRIRVWSLGPESLRKMLPANELALLDKDDSRVKTKMLYDENGDHHPTRDLLGHVGGVHGVAFSPDRQLIVSGGSDGTVRLWSSLLWGGALTVWRDHLLPVWSVAWAPVYGHYVATGGADRSAHLYSTDHAPDALRVFVGHRADVTSVCLHPNVNYLATGSADRAVRLFDVRSGKLVRLYTGHKGSVQCLAFSPCGRYLASGGWCGAVCIWDLGSGHQVGQLGGYAASRPLGQSHRRTEVEESFSPSTGQWLTGPVVSLAYCPDHSGRLAAGGLEGVVRLWNVNTGRSTSHTPRTGSSNTTSAGPSAIPGLVGLHRASKQKQLGRNQGSGSIISSQWAGYYTPVSGSEVSDTCLSETFFTRRTSVLGLQYVHPYLMLAAGPYNQQ
ncbi:Transcription initiation factor TFIID subunit 5 protein [Fasciola gigantica]|uniref:Transcription initiation factor TFIID subunit 5 protein n=2 Tax=Fasciola gigantica TaxID=46835 RepID=A0A504Y6I6_FASGI|nr:Transcription initiation factor TFIID subunit 5 protein [Fasciola gigantica]